VGECSREAQVGQNDKPPRRRRAWALLRTPPNHFGYSIINFLLKILFLLEYTSSNIKAAFLSLTRSQTIQTTALKKEAVSVQAAEELKAVAIAH